MSGLFVRIDSRLNRRLTEFCSRKGYKKGFLIERLIQNFLGKAIQKSDPIQEAQDFGIDLTLLDGNLKRTPTERLEHHAQAHQFVSEIRGKARHT